MRRWSHDSVVNGGHDHKGVIRIVAREFGGAERDRTADLDVANVALSQLSYGPSGNGADTVRGDRLSQAPESVCRFTLEQGG